MEFLYGYAYFVIYAFLGWVCEDIYCGIGKRKFINRGFLYGPYCPIYGFGAILVLYPLLALGKHPVYVFLLGTLITSLLEYVTSWGMEKLFHTRWWDYSERKWNIHGRVCFRNSVLFGLLCLVVVFWVHPIIQGFVMDMPVKILIILLILFTIGFSVDIVMTVVALMKRKKVLQRIKEDVEMFYQEYEKDRQVRLEAVSENIMQWIQQHPEFQEQVDRLKQSAIRLDAMQKAHIAHAFPERRLHESLKEFTNFAKNIKEQLDQTNR